MKTLLLTGFEPFGTDTVNPSWEAVKMLPDTVGEWMLQKRLLPVIFGKAAEEVIAAAESTGADAVLCVGLAGSRKALTPETIGINKMTARIPDNAGQMPADEPSIPGGPDGIFSTLPVRRMAEAISAAGVPAQNSYSAGTYVCNDTLYRVLVHFSGTEVRAGFIHVPACPEMTKDGSGMLISDIAKGLAAAIMVL